MFGVRCSQIVRQSWIFTAYYFMEKDGNGFGGTRHIAASFFRLP